jgi:hypothetical protein
LEKWKRETMQEWKDGRTKDWNDGIMEGWPKEMFLNPIFQYSNIPVFHPVFHIRRS